MTDLRPYAEASDEALMARSAEGDPRAFDEIVCRHGPFALRVASRLVRDAATAEDLVQEAMVRAWRHAGRFDARRARLTTWLYRIVVNLCIDHRRRDRAVRLPDGFDAADPGDTALERIEARQRRDLLARALDALPPRQKAAVTLVYDEGLSGAETAEILGISPKAVERLLARARADLRGRLGPWLADAGGRRC